MNLYGFAGGDPVNYSDPFGLCPPKDTNVQDCESVEYWRGRAGESSSGAGKLGNTIMAGLAAVGEDIKAEAQGNEVGDCGRKYSCGVVPNVSPGGGGGGLAKGIAKTIKRAQGADVSFSQLGKFTRAVWEVAGDKGSGYVRWNRVLNEEGSTLRLFKDVYRQGGEFLRRDWYIGGP